MAMRSVTRSGLLAYDIASAVRRRSLSRMIKRAPRSFVMPPEHIEAQTAFRIGPTLQHVVKEITGKEPPLQTVLDLISEGQTAGHFVNYGEAIFISRHRIDDLMILLGIPKERKDEFMAEARSHYLLHEYVYAAQASGHFGSDFRSLPRGNYIEREYSILTRDGKLLSLTRLVNLDKVKTNDDNPSVLLVPGIACNGRFFDLDNETSLALDHADQGRWVYLFDPRGLGKNKGDFDPQCFFDTLVSNDLPAAVEFIRNRPSPKKPLVIIGHSMGGMISEFMLIRQAYKMNQLARSISKMIGDPTFTTKGKTRPEIAAMLDKVEAGLAGRRKADREVKALVAEARDHLEILASVKGLVTLGSPKIFDKNEHPIYPLLLLLNIFLPLLREEEVPVDKGKWLIRLMPSLTFALRHLINADNFKDPKAFLAQLVTQGTDSFPLGIGLQLLKAVYSGRGVRRMDRDKFNYSAHLDEIPPDLPIFHIVGTKDPLAPEFNLGFIDRRHGLTAMPAIATFPKYSHQQRQVIRIDAAASPDDIPISDQASQVRGFAIEGLGHLDFFYGQTGNRIVRPLLDRLINTIWSL